MKTNKHFPNGVTSYLETHYEIVSMLEYNYNHGDTALERLMETKGTGGLYELAESMTDSFERENEDRDWEDGDYFEEIESFFNTQINKLN